jgi:hypothetical protein
LIEENFPEDLSSSFLAPNTMQKKILRWQETIFFIIYLILFPMFTALQYSSDYGKDTFINTFTYLGISKIFDLLPFIIFYKTIIPKFLFTRRYLAFILGLIGFLVAFDLYLHFVTDLVVSKMSFLPKRRSKDCSKRLPAAQGSAAKHSLHTNESGWNYRAGLFCQNN